MTLQELKEVLNAHPDHSLTFQLPDQKVVPAHFHITEVAKREKNFVDCGGTTRRTESCALQLWVALDIEHRLSSSKLSGILRHADKFFTNPDIPVEIDHQLGSLTTFNLGQIEISESSLIFQLTPVNAACLAPDKCGITPDLMPLPSLTDQATSSCTPNSGCC